MPLKTTHSNKRIIPINIHSKSQYKEYIDAIYKKGFCVPIDQIGLKLHISPSFIKQNMLNEIPYFVYDFRYSYGPKNLGNCRTCVRAEDVEKWLKKHAKYSRQSEFIDLYYYLSSYPKIASKALKMAKNNKARTGLPLRKGVLSEELLAHVNTSLSLNYKLKNCLCYRRNEVKWSECEGDLWGVAPKDIYRYDGKESSEEFYRKAFMNGDTKVKIGNKITLFIKNKQNTDKMKIPFLVPYNYTIRVVGKRK